MTTREQILTYLHDHGETRREVLIEECGGDTAVLRALSELMYIDAVCHRQEGFIHYYSLPLDDAA